ncbi:prolipoprotein diacylglyceryl transferase [Atopobacter phocae]|uniref:prolipoprotein diacylglyceryl transferase n=1 Tax=Atopobacter phocae TaxID=136492 RepID=UPI0004B9B2F0|nr:prolipoprotein diacylglyceryl transferase [Atopobacter phocae]
MMAAINPIAFHVFNWPVYWYGIIITAAIIIAADLSTKESIKKGFKKDFVWDLLIWALPLAFLGARLYYVIFEWSYYREHLNEVLAIHKGGIAIYGGLLAGMLVAFIFTKKRYASFILFLDIAAPYVLLAQSIGRWGNFVNQEAHGTEVSRQFLEQLHLPEVIIQQMLIDGQYYHPTFLYESLVSVSGVVLLLLIRRYAPIRVGDLVSFYLIWYSTGRFFIEGMRTDSLYIIGDIRASQVVALMLIVVGVLSIVYRYTHKKQYMLYRDVTNPYQLSIL